MKDIDEVSGVNILQYDICIIGTGPAGITLCAELADANLRICLLESGGPHKNRRNDELRRVISEGIVIKDYSRERVIGGASSTWSGLSAPLDPIDMSERPFLKVPGWPISYQELKPYWEAAAEHYRFPKEAVFDEFTRLREAGDLRPSWNGFSEKVFIAASEPQRFAKEHQAVLIRKNVDTFYNATVLSLEGSTGNGGDGNIVHHVAVISNGGEKYKIGARFFVLATGGIENARLLLASTDINQNGLGNEHDQVGRCFMNHPKNNYGVIKLKHPVHDAPYFFGCLRAGYAGYAGLHLKESVQRDLGVLNPYIRFEPIYPWSNNKGVEAAIFLLKKARAILALWKKTKARRTVALRDYAETGDDSPLQNSKKTLSDWLKIGVALAVNMPIIARYVYARLFSKHSPVIRKVRIRNFMEMEPCPENRVVLSDEIDACGQRVPLVRLETSDLDRRSLIALHRILAQEVESAEWGTFEGALESEPSWPIDQDASHHLGTTRMGKDPATSVVNENLRLHSVVNVYCAGGSVFPTSGCANPTFTMCALSIRLAEYLKKAVAKTSAS